MKKLLFLLAILTILTSCSKAAYYEVDGKVIRAENKIEISDKLYIEAINNPGKIVWKKRLESVDSSTIHSIYNIELHGELLGLFYDGNEVSVIKKKGELYIEKFLLVLHLFLTGSMILLLAVFVLTGKKWAFRSTWILLIGITFLWIYFGIEFSLKIDVLLLLVFYLNIHFIILNRKIENKKSEKGPEEFFFKHTKSLIITIYLLIILLGAYPYIMP